MINLRKAKIEESEKILEFYQNLIESIKGTEFKPKWGDYYPDLEYIKTSIGKQELHLHTKEDNIVACIVLNNRFDPEYDNIDWIVDAEAEKIIIIHAFA